MENDLLNRQRVPFPLPAPLHYIDGPPLSLFSDNVTPLLRQRHEVKRTREAVHRITNRLALEDGQDLRWVGKGDRMGHHFGLESLAVSSSVSLVGPAGIGMYQHI